MIFRKMYCALLEKFTSEPREQSVFDSLYFRFRRKSPKHVSWLGNVDRHGFRYPLHTCGLGQGKRWRLALPCEEEEEREGGWIAKVRSKK